MVRLGIKSDIILKNPLIARNILTEMTTILRKTEVIETERKTKTLMISIVLVLAILSGIAVMAYANGLTNNTSVASDAYGWGYYNGTCGFPGRRGHGWGRGGFMSVTVSQEFKDNVINIAKSDSDVQNLLNDGYNITDVRPIINAMVEADGTVTLKATSAIVMLSKDTTGRATVWVDLEQAKVTRIIILTRTVIEKS